MDLERLAASVPAANQKMHVRVVGIVVVDRDPLQPRTKITFHVRYESPGVRLEVEAVCVLR